MPDRSKRMKPIHRLAANHEQEAARQLGTALRILEQHRNQLDKLREYKDEYLQQFSRQGGEGMSGAQLRDYQRFLDNIDSAIRDQQQRLVYAETACNQSRSEWQNRHQRSQVLENVISRFKTDEMKLVEKRIQRELEDAFGARHKPDK